MRNWLFAAASFCVSATISVAADAPTSRPAISVMPLGDSITAGVDGGYRKPLAERLSSVYHIDITTVGSQIDDKLPPGQQAHEGHPGWRIDQLAENLLGRNLVDSGAHGGYWLVGGHDTGRDAVHPTFVTVMAGINDINQMIGDAKKTPIVPMSERADAIEQTIQQRMEQLIDTLTTTLPDSTILLGGCIPFDNGLLDEKLTGANEANRKTWAKSDNVSEQQELGVNHFVLLFNQWQRDTFVPQLQQRRKKVYYVDVYSKFVLPDGSVRGWNNKEPENSNGPAGYGDYGLHPNLFGYGQMADAWAKAITEQAGKQ